MNALGKGSLTCRARDLHVASYSLVAFYQPYLVTCADSEGQLLMYLLDKRVAMFLLIFAPQNGSSEPLTFFKTIS